MASTSGIAMGSLDLKELEAELGRTKKKVLDWARNRQSVAADRRDLHQWALDDQSGKPAACSDDGKPSGRSELNLRRLRQLATRLEPPSFPLGPADKLRQLQGQRVQLEAAAERVQQSEQPQRMYITILMHRVFNLLATWLSRQLHQQDCIVAASQRA